MHTWWDDDPGERYWMEITDRENLGEDLFAPQTDDAGRPYWSYNLVSEVRSGDIVLHWHKALIGVPAIVGWSLASGSTETDTIVWQAHGTSGRSRGTASSKPAWRMPLTDYTPLLDPVTQDVLRREEPALRKVHAELVARHGIPLYFPFDFSDKRPVRTAQGYLVKFPAALLPLIDELDDVPAPGSAPRPPRTTPKPAPAQGDAGYQTDPRVRRAVELHAVDHASDHYAQRGYEVTNVGGYEAYDLLVNNGTETRHVEVKGSTGVATNVVLTHGEVRHASAYQPTDLYVVDNIEWWREADGSVRTDGGTARVWHDWSPSPGDLSPTQYRYTPPPT